MQTWLKPGQKSIILTWTFINKLYQETIEHDMLDTMSAYNTICVLFVNAKMVILLYFCSRQIFYPSLVFLLSTTRAIVVTDRWHCTWNDNMHVKDTVKPLWNFLYWEIPMLKNTTLYKSTQICIQLSAVITRSNITRYCMHQCSDGGTV